MHVNGTEMGDGNRSVNPLRRQNLTARGWGVLTAIVGIARGETLAPGATIRRLSRRHRAYAVVWREQQQNRHNRDGYVNRPAHSFFTLSNWFVERDWRGVTCSHDSPK